jgi:penicillin V acylase-like amidase (Ntn superfamily)
MKTIKMFFICLIVLSLRSQAQTMTDVDLLGCSTFMLCNEKSYLIGHNLDTYMEVPGMIYINKRGLEKESISFVQLLWGATDTLPKLKWISKYGSVTYNPIGCELIDGGLNEAGIYIGEMSLNKNCKYAVSSNKPKIAVALWLQYILDSFASVDEVVKFVSEVSVDGGYMFNWHFFVTDKKGNQAIIEFINGKTVIYQNNEIPIKLLCNNPYIDDLNRLKQYKGFGGNKDIELKNKSEENRFIDGAQMLELNKRNPADSDVNYAFEILKQLDFGPTKWSIVYDVKNMKMYYRTNKGINIKRIDFSSFDFSCSKPIMMLDINKDLPGGDVKEYFIPYTKQLNKAQLEKAFMCIEGMKEEKTFPEMIERLANYQETVKCK